jgi:hypothetical protein
MLVRAPPFARHRADCDGLVSAHMLDHAVGDHVRVNGL